MADKRLAFDRLDTAHVAYHNMVHAASLKRGQLFTKDKAQQLFADFKAANFMANANSGEGCIARRSLIQILLIERGVTVHTARCDFGEGNKWYKHEAAAFNVDGSNEIWVLDTGLRNALETFENWKDFLLKTQHDVLKIELIEDASPHFTLIGAMKHLERLHPFEEHTDSPRPL